MESNNQWVFNDIMVLLQDVGIDWKSKFKIAVKISNCVRKDDLSELDKLSYKLEGNIISCNLFSFQVNRIETVENIYISHNRNLIKRLK